MKARGVDLTGARLPAEAERRVLDVRAREVLDLAGSLDGGNPRDLHDLRIACKRLRYTLELIGAAEDDLRLDGLRAMQDELGALHDADELVNLAERRGIASLAESARAERIGRLAGARFRWRAAALEMLLSELVSA